MNTKGLRVGIVGAGVIGGDLAYAFASSLAKGGAVIRLLDINQEALAAALRRIKGYAGKAVSKGKMSERAASGLLAAIQPAQSMANLVDCGVVVEAASEDLGVKRTLRERITAVVAPDTLILSTTSSIPRQCLIGDMRVNRDRYGIFHPFTPAWRSPAVELVGDREGPYWQKMLKFAVAAGKVPIVVKDTPCFAGNDIFIALCVEACRLVEEGVGTVAQVNAVCDQVVGGSGAFNVLNITGANSIGVFCCNMMAEMHGSWWIPPRLLADQGKRLWDLSGDTVCDERTRIVISERLMAVILSRAIWLVDHEVISATDLDWLCRMALGFKFGPVARFNQNPAEAKRLCRAYEKGVNPNFAIPQSVDDQAPVKFYSNLKVETGPDGIAVVTIFRPEALNALNSRTMEELDAAFRELAQNDRAKGVVLMGYGGALAGADITELVRLTDPEQAEVLAANGQAVLNYIERMPKPVLAVLDGPVLGGGAELAMACHGRVVGPNLLAGQPEVNLGIIPGYGGTQRLPRLVGFEKAMELLRTGQTFGAQEAVEMGWAKCKVDDPLAHAKDLLRKHFEIADPDIRPINPAPMAVPDETPRVDIGHHSRAIDAVLVGVAREGLAKPLSEGLSVEAAGFGACLLTRDARIGLQNFMTNGPRVPAVFINA